MNPGQGNSERVPPLTQGWGPNHLSDEGLPNHRLSAVQPKLVAENEVKTAERNSAAMQGARVREDLVVDGSSDDNLIAELGQDMPS
jgi:hypothetical protein